MPEAFAVLAVSLSPLNLSIEGEVINLFIRVASDIAVASNSALLCFAPAVPDVFAMPACNSANEF